jgi:prepilin-type N-terminal cleavage/methylation domain-containing protein
MKTRGFTLVEILVVITIVLLLTSVAFFQYNEAGKKSRDGNRQSNLEKVQAALELYRQKYGKYPAGCRGVGVWSGQIGTSYACAGGGSQYIVGLAPEFISTLPQETKLNGVDSGYVYTSDAAGTVYKFEAKKTVESETVISNTKMASCDVNDPEHVDGGICGRVAAAPWGGNQPDWCQDGDPIFSTSYAVWGGYANAASPVAVEQGTENVICAIQ